MDESRTVAAAARGAGLRPGDVLEWARARRTADALAHDMADARDPAPAARALPDGLASSGEVVRYTAPSYLIHGPGRSVFAIPGFRPAETYTTVIANLLPTVTPRRPPESAATVLHWAGQPLAMMEVAAVLGVNADAAPAGTVGYSPGLRTLSRAP